MTLIGATANVGFVRLLAVACIFFLGRGIQFMY
jgi:hypothetical protein